ncbi:ion channel [Thalassococcus sp. S3]|uniref:ion channel n=1 Tax=Thalassococcus sp. S3 TaxID=2017482 RepID=UPI0010242412|nr:ion channel [Thalassococcus sp. S3]QBF31009.1 Ion transport 2 [Thalassococcus sp. S3]
MDWGFQVLWGTALLATCAVAHIGIVAISIPLFQKLFEMLDPGWTTRRIAVMLCFGVLVIAFAHTVQIWTWALSFFVFQGFESFEASFYFATATYTTLGYGDLVLGQDLRVFGTFASITGLLTFGISTSLLITLIVRLMPTLLDDPE